MYDILLKFSQFFFQAQITPGSSDHRLGQELGEWPMCDGPLRAHRGCAAAVTVTGCIAQSFCVRALCHCHWIKSHWIATATYPAKLSQPPGIRNTRKAMKANLSSFAMFLGECVFFCPPWILPDMPSPTPRSPLEGMLFNLFFNQSWWSFKNRPGCLAHNTVTLVGRSVLPAFGALWWTQVGFFFNKNVEDSFFEKF